MQMQSPGEFVAFYAMLGAKKACAKGIKIFLAAILAGFLIGMGGAAASMASCCLGNASIARFVSGVIFPFGLIAVIFTGSELFTGNCLMEISVLSGTVSAGKMARSLCIAYLGNFAGAAALAAGTSAGGLLDLSGGSLAVSVIQTAASKCNLTFAEALIRGIFCNILVCTGVMCGLCAKNAEGKAAGAFGPVCFFVLCGFEHCVANMYYIPAGLLALRNPLYQTMAIQAGADLSGLTLSGFLFGNLFPVTLGNLLGGCTFAAIIWLVHREKTVNI